MALGIPSDSLISDNQHTPLDVFLALVRRARISFEDVEQARDAAQRLIEEHGQDQGHEAG